MNLISDLRLGIFLLIMLSVQGAVMLVCTGRFPQIKPEGQGIVMVENCCNTSILLIFIPLIAVLLITGYYPIVDLTHVTIGIPWLICGLEAIGIAFILYGTALVVLGFLELRKTFQPGGFAPRSQDRLITRHIYSLVRHPLNAGVLATVLGIALTVQSLFVVAVFIVYLILVLSVLSLEEKQLSETFGEEYRSYSQKVKRLVPFIY